MRNLFARLWGKKPEEEQAPATRTVGQDGAADKDDDLARTVERYRQQRAEERRHAQEAYTAQAEATYGPAATWPRLSETLDGPRHPRFCQSCGAERPSDVPGEGEGEALTKVTDITDVAGDGVGQRKLRRTAI